MKNLQYFIRTADGFFGPFPSRRKANRCRYIKYTQIVWDRHCGILMPVPLISVRASGIEPKDSQTISATLEQVCAWEECQYIDNRMLADAR